MPVNLFRGQIQKVKGQRHQADINAVNEVRCHLSVSYILDGERGLVSSTSAMTSKSKVKVARSRDAYDRCWPINRERKLKLKEIGRKVDYSSFKVKRSN